MTSKENIIDKVYNEFYGSIKSVFEEAKKVDNTIKYDDVKKYFEKNMVRKTNLKGYNSFIANNFRDEYQIDLFFMNEAPARVRYALEMRTIPMTNIK